MPEQNDKLKTLTQAGAVGISILLILLIWKMFDEGLSVIRDNTVIMTRLVELIENPRIYSAIANLLPSHLMFR